MLLLISDANILMDMDVADLLKPMFALCYQFAVPDVLYYQELREQHAYLLDMGLQIRPLSAKGVKRVQALSEAYGAKTSRIDLFALALAEVECCSLLTGDAALRKAAEAENLDVKGTIWLIVEMVKANVITVDTAKAAFEKMRLSGRRLPWDKAAQMLNEIE